VCNSKTPSCHRLIRHNATVPQLKAGLLAG
jgi:hypothetical protein